MISGAEASRIGRALESVADWTSEIIIVLNADVSDGTEEIAVQHGAKVFREPWKGHVAQKNSAAEKASQPWILGLDADEEVSPELREEMAAALKSPGSTAAFNFPRCTWFGGRWIRHGDWYPDRQTRLWRKDRAVWQGVNPHDRLEVDGPIVTLRAELRHYTAETLDQFVRKTLIYADIFAQECAARGRRISPFDLATRPAWRFVRGFFLRLGFLDGWQGLSIAWLGAFYTYLRYAKALEAQRKNPRPG